VVDLGILAIVLLSAAMAYYRGMVRELSTILSWVSAAVIAFFLFPYGRDIARTIIPMPLIADAIAGIVLFSLALLPLTLLMSLIFSQFSKDEPGLIDRISGTAFGIIRGFFLVAIAYWGSLLLVLPGQEPAWIKDAVTFPIVKKLAVVLPKRSVVVDESGFSGHEEGAEGIDNTDGDQSNNNDGYPQNDRRSLEKLVATTSES